MTQNHAEMILAIVKLVEARYGKPMPTAIDHELCRLIDSVRQAILGAIKGEGEGKT